MYEYTVTTTGPSDGMTLRDYFAAKAMAFYLDSAERITPAEDIARRAYYMADAMMAERDKGSAQK